MTSEKAIVLADGEFEFKKIEKIQFNGQEFPVIDLQSLYCAKLRHKMSLEEKVAESLKNVEADINKLKQLLSKNHYC